MSTEFTPHTRRNFVGTVGHQGRPTPAREGRRCTTSIRPFRINVPEEDLADLRRRLAATRWPTKELVEDRSQGVRLATIQELARYWATEYDWRKVRGD